MTNPTASDANTGQANRATRFKEGSAASRRKTTAAPPRKPNVAGAADLAGVATSQAKGAVGAVRRKPAGAGERGRSAGTQAAGVAGRAVTGAAQRGRDAGKHAVNAGQRTTSVATERARATGDQAGRTAGAVTKAGRGTTGDAIRGTAGAAGAGRKAVGQVVSTTTGAGKTLAGAAVGSAVRIGARMALSFLIGRALLLLELIKRLSRAAVDALSRVAGLLQERLASSRSRSDDFAHSET